MNAAALAVLMLLAAVVQVNLPTTWVPFDGVLLLAIFTGLWRGNGSGTYTGFIGGLVMDVLVGPVLRAWQPTVCMEDSTPTNR